MGINNNHGGHLGQARIHWEKHFNTDTQGARDRYKDATAIVKDPTALILVYNPALITARQ
jgi:hypothetical protein